MSSTNLESHRVLSRQEKRIRRGETALFNRLIEAAKNLSAADVDIMYEYSARGFDRNDWNLPETFSDIPVEKLDLMRDFNKARHRIGVEVVDRVMTRYRIEIAGIEQEVLSAQPVTLDELVETTA